MPIQNFRIECEIDGYRNKLTGEPKAKDGGFNLTIHQRLEGKVIKVLEVMGSVRANGDLALDILMNDNSLPIKHNHERIVTKR